MIYSSQEMDMRLNPSMGRNHLVFEFKGKFTEEGSKQAVEAWSQVFDGSVMKYTLVWDCTKMDGFELAAKKAWRVCLNRYQSRIREVVVISDSILIRGAARLLVKALPMPARVIKSAQELAA